jgi:hypothetical protein
MSGVMLLLALGNISKFIAKFAKLLCWSVGSTLYITLLMPFAALQTLQFTSNICHGRTLA